MNFKRLELYLSFSFISFIMAFSSVSKAYDVDTHFYATYSMARFAGFKHEVAAKIATATQWPDETYMISNPTSAINIAIFSWGAEIRRQIHFAGAAAAGEISSYSHKGKRINVKTIEDNLMAHEMIMEGFKEGDLIKAATGLHTLEDSFAHAGTPALLGHAAWGHWPDRPQDDTGKYDRMVHAVMSALVAMRDLVPRSAIDTRVRSNMTSGLENYKTDAKTLADAYMALPEVNTYINHDYMADHRYVKNVVRFFFLAARDDAGYIYPNSNKFNLEKWLSQLQYDDTMTAPDVLVKLVFEIMAKERDLGIRIFNPEKLADIGFYYDKNSVEAEGGIINFVNGIVEHLTMNFVPQVLTKSNRFEMEVEGPIRELEMDIRIHDMRKTIEKLFGINTYFQPNPLLEHKGDAVRALLGLPTKIVGHKAGIPVTFKIEEEFQWNKMLLSYMFPSCKDFLYSSNAGKALDTWLYVISFGAFSSCNISSVRHDLHNHHLVPSRGNKWYRVPGAWADLVLTGKVKQIVSQETLNAWAAESQTDKFETGALYATEGAVQP